MKYVVQLWDNKNTIASRFGVTINQLESANPLIFGRPVYPGMVINIPGYRIINLPSEGYIEYIIQPGDTLANIASRFGLDLSRVISHNPQIVNPAVIWPGQIIYLIYLGY